MPSSCGSTTGAAKGSAEAEETVPRAEGETTLEKTVKYLPEVGAGTADVKETKEDVKMSS